MNNLSYIYIFSLFILFIPGVLIEKTKDFGYLLHSVLFLVVFYFTVPIVNNEKESYTIEIDGTNNLADVLQKYSKNEDDIVVVNNHLRAPENNFKNKAEYSELIETAYIKIQEQEKEIMYLENKIKLYSGTGGQIDKLDLEIKELKTKVMTLQNLLSSYTGSDTTLDNLNTALSTLQKEKSELEIKVNNLTSKTYDYDAIQDELIECRAKSNNNSS